MFYSHMCACATRYRSQRHWFSLPRFGSAGHTLIITIEWPMIALRCQWSCAELAFAESLMSVYAEHAWSNDILQLLNEYAAWMHWIANFKSNLDLCVCVLIAIGPSINRCVHNHRLDAVNRKSWSVQSIAIGGSAFSTRVRFNWSWLKIQWGLF